MSETNYGQRIVKWYESNHRQMPWRETSDPYKIWLSEVMLQQTQVDTVIPYYLRFVEAFPNVESLATADLELIHNYWQGLGYYRRGNNLQKGAQYIVNQHQGKFPEELAPLLKVPGIGPYTAGALLSIAFHKPAPAVDGNVMRVLSRQFAMEADISIEKNKKIFETKVMALMPSNPNSFNQGLMELGATVCTPKNPKCLECPVMDTCKAYQESNTDKYPYKSIKIKQPIEHYFVLIIKSQNKILLQKRPENGLLAGLYGLPMIARENMEAAFDLSMLIGAGTLVKESISCHLGLPLIKHTFTHKKWWMQAVEIEITEEQAEQFRLEEPHVWVVLDDLEAYPIGTAFIKALVQMNNKK